MPFLLFNKRLFYYNKTLRNTGILKKRHKCFKNITIHFFSQSIFILSINRNLKINNNLKILENQPKLHLQKKQNYIIITYSVFCLKIRN